VKLVGSLREAVADTKIVVLVARWRNSHSCLAGGARRSNCNESQLRRRDGRSHRPLDSAPISADPRRPHPHLHPGAAATRCISEKSISNLKNELPCMERLGMARRRVALDAAKAQVAAEQVRIEPLVAALRGKAFQQRRDFLVDRRR